MFFLSIIVNHQYGVSNVDILTTFEFLKDKSSFEQLCIVSNWDNPLHVRKEVQKGPMKATSQPSEKSWPNSREKKRWPTGPQKWWFGRGISVFNYGDLEGVHLSFWGCISLNYRGVLDDLALGSEICSSEKFIDVFFFQKQTVAWWNWHLFT